MRRFLLDKLICPNTGTGGFRVLPARLRRGQEIRTGQAPGDALEQDDVLDGVLVHEESGFGYPIRYGVASLLSRADIDQRAYQDHLEALRPHCPPRSTEALLHTLRCAARSAETRDGEWNRGEMRYYDAEVDTEEKRARMCDDVQARYLPHIFLLRQKHIFDRIAPDVQGKTVLEIGCGNARTASRLMPPHNHYTYIGVDISFYRLVVAKGVCPEGEFIQASALNLPIADEAAHVGLSFGMLHHLPRPLLGLRELHRVLAPGGVLAFHEPISTPKLVAGRFPRLERALHQYEHSEHDGAIPLEEFLCVLEQMGYRLVDRRFANSPFRTLAELLLNRTFPAVLGSSRFFAALLAFDSMLIATVCRLSSLLAPRAAIVLATRERDVEHPPQKATCFAASDVRNSSRGADQQSE